MAGTDSRISADESTSIASYELNHCKSPLRKCLYFACYYLSLLSQQSADDYMPLIHPLPSLAHTNYPLYTPGGEDLRWSGSGLLEEGGNHWVGGLLLTAQLVTKSTRQRSGELPELQDLDLVLGPGRSQYASFTWADLDAIAPWMTDLVTKRIEGFGLGI